MVQLNSLDRSVSNQPIVSQQSTRDLLVHQEKSTKSSFTPPFSTDTMQTTGKGPSKMEKFRNKLRTLVSRSATPNSTRPNSPAPTKQKTSQKQVQQTVKSENKTEKSIEKEIPKLSKDVFLNEKIIDPSSEDAIIAELEGCFEEISIAQKQILKPIPKSTKTFAEQHKEGFISLVRASENDPVRPFKSQRPTESFEKNIGAVFRSRMKTSLLKGMDLKNPDKKKLFPNLRNRLEKLKEVYISWKISKLHKSHKL